MKKKTVVILSVVAVLVIALIAGLIVFLSGVFSKNSSDKKVNGSNGTATITVGDVSAKTGDTIKVPVKIKNNPGAMGYMLEFDYDTSALKYKNYSKGDFLKDYDIKDNDGVIKFISVESKDIEKDGTIINLEFTVLDSAKSGTYKIKLIEDENAICNYDEKSISYKAVDGKVTVK